MKIIGDKTLVLKDTHVAYILDVLSNCAWKMANPIISDIMNQLKESEGKEDAGKV